MKIQPNYIPPPWWVPTQLPALACLQARDDEFHPAKTVFLVDSDFAPSRNLRAELAVPEVQRRLLEGWEAPRATPQVPQVLRETAISGAETGTIRAPAVNSSSSNSTSSVIGTASLGAVGEDGRREDQRRGAGEEMRRIVAAVVPCLEFVDGEKGLEDEQQVMSWCLAIDSASSAREEAFAVARSLWSHTPTCNVFKVVLPGF